MQIQLFGALNVDASSSFGTLGTNLVGTVLLSAVRPECLAQIDLLLECFTSSIARTMIRTTDAGLSSFHLIVFCSVRFWSEAPK